MGGVMKPLTCLVLLSAILLMSSVGNARNEVLRFLIDDAMTQPKAAEKLNDSVRMFFGDQEHPPVEREIGTYTSNKKTNAFNKSDKKACEWAFLSAMISLQSRAIQMGADAVINIRSYYYKNDFSSATEYECGAGNVVAGVTMIGEVVKLAEGVTTLSLK